MRMRPAAGALFCLVLPTLACFQAVLIRDGQFAYRDSGNFYYPLYLRVQQEWGAGRWPLWMPEENSGLPLLANPTAAVLYPGKLIFAALPYPWAMRVYVVAHVALAFCAMRALLRHWSISPTGATIGATAYAFGAPVLFQYSNVVFLVGAAWMPLGLRSADRWVRLGDRRALGGLAAVLAIQTLGGDPEAAYLVAIAASGYAIGRANGEGRAPSRIPRLSWIAIAVGAYAGLLALGRLLPAATQVLALVSWLAVAGWAIRGVVRRRRLAGPEGSLLGLGAACVLALMIGGAQVVPTIEFLARSDRAVALGAGDRYAFSLSPSRTIGALWPNVMGTVAAPQEWLLALPAWFDETRQWVPSLYLGGLALVLAAAGAGLRGGPPWRPWLTAIAVVGTLASLGEYTSPLFWARKAPALAARLGPPDDRERGGARTDGALADGDGGVYWALTAAFPGFRSFRYPAKMLVPACLGIAGLAGLGWDDLSAGHHRRRAVVTGIAMAGLGVVALSALLAGRTAASGALASRADRAATAFGPLDPAAVLRTATGALGHGTLVAALAAGIAASAARRPVAAAGMALALMAADLAVANARLVVTAPQAAFDAEPRAVRLIRETERAHPSPGPFRMHRMRWSPTDWALRDSPDRTREMLAWERDTLGGHHAVPFGLGYVDSKGTIELADYSLFFRQGRVALDPDAARELGLKPGQEVVYHTRRGYDLWGARYLLLPARLAWNSLLRGYTSFLSDFDEVYPPPGTFDGPGGRERREAWLRHEDFQILRNRAAFPRAWVVHRARFPAIRDDGPGERRPMIDEILFQNDELWHDDRRRVHDPREVAWIEEADRRLVVPGLSGGPGDPSEDVTVIRDDPARVELVARLKAPGLVVLADTYYPGWRLRLDGRAARILRTNGAMRGALVGAGEHRLVYRYDPASLRIGIAITIVGLAALFGLLAAASRAGRQPVGAPVPVASA